MNENQKLEFKTLIKTTMDIYQQEVTVDTLKVWWSFLSPYELKDVSNAFSQHMRDKVDGKFPPKPAHILEKLELIHSDGRLGADEAWALYPHNEHSSAVVTEEMHEAMSFAQNLLNEDDQVGARMAFKDAYNRITAQNKINGIKPKWVASLGSDKNLRETALTLAIEKGRISQSYAVALLPTLKLNSALVNIEI